MKQRIKDLIKNSNAYIVISDVGIACEGATPELLSLYTMLTEEMADLKGSNKEIVKSAFELAYKTDEEKVTYLYNILKEHIENHKTKEQE